MSFSVPVTAGRLIFEFLSEDRVVGVYSMPVRLVAGQVLILTDPDFKPNLPATKPSFCV